MAPTQPPLPTPWNLPFHPSDGSQTSILMSESLLGRKVAATRQKAGRLLGETGDGMNPPPGIVNAPAATVCASVMVVSGSAKDARLSQVPAWAWAAPESAITAGTLIAKRFHRFESISNRLYRTLAPTESSCSPD